MTLFDEVALATEAFKSVDELEKFRRDGPAYQALKEHMISLAARVDEVVGHQDEVKGHQTRIAELIGAS